MRNPLAGWFGRKLEDAIERTATYGPEAAGEPSPAPAEGDPPKRGRADHLRPYRFARGTSGNPGGRPKGRSTKAVLNELLELPNREGVTARERLGEVLLAKALTGNLGAIKELFDRADGRAKQAVDLGGDVTIRVEYADSHVDAPEASPGAAEGPSGPETV